VIRARRGAVRAAAALVGLALLSGCTSVAGLTSPPQPTWEPKAEGPAPNDAPTPQGGGGGAAPGEPGAPGGPGQPGQADDPNVVATNLRLPWGLAVLPDNSAIVGERATGRILQVRSLRTPPKVVMTVPGLDATGDGGLLDLVLSPSYRDDRLVFAYVTTKTDNRVVRFEVGGRVTPVLVGIPRGKTGNGGRLAFDPDGNLLVGTGDAGRPASAADPRSLAGKVLRVTAFGRPAAGNPSATSPIYSSGHRSVTGLCVDGADHVFAAEPGAGVDELNQLAAGADYGWPASPRRAGTIAPTRTLAPAVAGLTGCAVLQRGLFVASLAGQRLWVFPIADGGKPGDPRPLLAGTYGRIRTVVAAPDGALWITTSNRDGQGRPTQQDDRVIRLVPPPNTTNSPA
jgi:glucose/arabinose dehydrogenase